MKWIIQILEIEPYTITCIWNNKEVRAIDLTTFILEKAEQPQNSYSQLKDTKRFKEAKCDGTTIYWEDGILIRDYDGEIKPAPLDIDPDVLFEMSYRVEENSVKKN